MCRANIKDFGAKGDGITDDTQVIQQVISTHPSVCIPPGEYLISQSLNISSGTDIEGVGINAAIFKIPNNVNLNVFNIDSQANIRLANFSITKETGNPNPSDFVKIHGVEISGNSSDILIEHLLIDGCFRGFNIVGGEGGNPGTAQRITFRDCRATHNITPTKYTGQYGFNLNDCDEITLSDCYADNHWLDGVKLRKKTKNVTIKGGSFNNNGVSIIEELAGDGIDAYAGGDTFTITDTICDNNSGNGITIKTGPFNNSPDAEEFGYVKNITLTGLRTNNNNSQGVYLTRSSGQNPEQPLVSSITILGGLFEGNGKSGLYLRGRNISIVAPLVKGNGESGILIPRNSFDVDIVAAKVIANGTNSPGSYPGIAIDGQRVQVRGGTINGKDADTITQDSDYTTALTPFHQYAIKISEVADQVLVDNVTVLHSARLPEILTRMTAGICIINQKGEGTPENKIYGGPGSQYIRTDGATGTVLYLKESGYGVQGWRPLGQAAAIVTLDNNNGVADGKIDNVGSSFDQAVLNDNFRELSDKLNDILTALKDAGLMES